MLILCLLTGKIQNKRGRITFKKVLHKKVCRFSLTPSFIYSLLKQKSRCTSVSPGLMEERSSCNDVPVNVMQKVTKNGYLHKYCLGKKGLRKENSIRSRAYGQGVAGALYFRVVCCSQSCHLEGLKYPTTFVTSLSAVILSN